MTDRLTWPLRLYRLALRAYPPAFRAECAEEMIETLRSHEAVIREARQRSRLIRFWYKELSSVIRSGLRLRMQRDELSVTKSREREQSATARVFSVVRQEIQFAVRTLHRHWALTSVVVLTLALGIGTSVATFNTLYVALLRPLPFPNPDRLVKAEAFQDIFPMRRDFDVGQFKEDIGEHLDF